MNIKLKILKSLIGGLWLFLIFGLWYLQIYRYDFYHLRSLKNFTRIVPLMPARGQILDRKLRVLAKNRIAFDIAINPQSKDKQKAFEFLSSFLGISVSKLKKTYRKNYIAPFVPVTIIKDLPKKKALKIEEYRMLYPQITIKTRPTRLYLLGPVFAHVLGYVRVITRGRLEQLKKYGYKQQDVIGYSGVEESYDAYLRGKPGLIKIAVDSAGRKKDFLAMIPPKKGETLVLTIDKDLQELVYTHLKGHKGAIIFMDPCTGEILCLCSYPSYDNNIFSSLMYKKERMSVLKDPNAPLLNRAISGLYPPGSTFKIVTAIAGLSSGVINAQTRFYCPGYFKLGGIKFGCAHIHKDEDIIEALAHSCNVFFFNVGLRAGLDNLVYFAKRFGLGQKTGIDLPGEKSGVLPNKQWKRKKFHRPWYDGDTLNLSIGQGYLLTTPIQILTLISAIANGGYHLRPYIVKYAGKYRVNYSKKKNLNLKKEFLELVKKGLEDAVQLPDGTAHILYLPDIVSVAGKTGTAQAGKNKPCHAWFAGYFPADKPKYAVVVFLEHGKSSYYACKLLREIIYEMHLRNMI